MCLLTASGDFVPYALFCILVFMTSNGQVMIAVKHPAVAPATA